MMLDQGTLRTKSVFGEGVAQESADARVKLDVVGGNEVVDLAVWYWPSQPNGPPTGKNDVRAELPK